MRFSAEKSLKSLIDQSDKLESKIANVFFFENFVISEIKEGIHLTYEKSLPLINTALEYYDGNPFGYISNRIYSYSLDPTDYFKLERIENLKCFAVVSYDKITSRNVSVERLFFGKPFKEFHELIKAVKWIKSIL